MVASTRMLIVTTDDEHPWHAPVSRTWTILSAVDADQNDVAAVGP